MRSRRNEHTRLRRVGVGVICAGIGLGVIAVFVLGSDEQPDAEPQAEVVQVSSPFASPAPAPPWKQPDANSHSQSTLPVEVRDVYGTPLAGVLVTAFGREFGSTDLEGRETIEWPDDLPQRGRLRLRADGFLETEASFIVPDGARGVMVPAAEIQGTVVHRADMLPVEGAVVSTGRSTTLTEADGAFFLTDISPGRHVLTARSPNGFGSTDPIEVDIAEIIDGVKVVLDAACTVHGAVHPAEKIDIPLNASVGAASADVREDGSFEIIGAKFDGRALFLSSAALGSSFAQVGPISIDPCSSQVEVELPSFSKAVLEVVDDAGEPVPGAEVEVQYRAESGSGGLAPFRTDLDGSCTVEGLGPGNLRIDVKIPGAEILDVDLPTSEPIIVRLRGAVRSVDGRLITTATESRGA